MGEGGMEVGGEGEYIPIATLSQDRVHKPQLLKRKESRSGIEPRSFRLPANRLTTRPHRFSSRGSEDTAQTKSRHSATAIPCHKITPAPPHYNFQAGP